MTIPKRLFTIWLSEDGAMPELVRRCIASQKIEGYEHDVITLDSLTLGLTDLPYVQQCLDSPHLKRKFCKLSDYLRMFTLRDRGGIYLDADVEVLPGRNFDALLDSGMFVGREQAGLEGIGMIPAAGTAVLGAEAGHPLLAEWLRRVEANFRGDDDQNYESSMAILNDLLWEWHTRSAAWALADENWEGAVAELPGTLFYPYCWRQGVARLTDDTICYHHFMKSWI